jgi:hypothetical protein
MLVQYANLKIADLTPAQLAKFGTWRCDQFYEKHESYGSWGEDLEVSQEYPELKLDFIDVGGFPVLLPRLPDDFASLRIDDWTISKDERVLTLFLTDIRATATYSYPEGWVGVCYRVADEDFYVAVVYHARYIVPGPVPR